MSKELQNMLDSLSGIALAVYLLMVIYKGNASALLAKSKGDAVGYLEFVIAGSIVLWLYNNPKTRILSPIIGLAFAGLLVSRANNVDIAAITKQFASGQTGMFDTLTKLLKGK